MAAVAIDFSKILKGVPRGAWVAISSDQERVITFGSDMQEVLEEAASVGENDPIVFRVPEAASALML
jgi:hypothetical protein